MECGAASQSPRGIMGVNLPHTVLLQATESIIISRSRWRGFSTVFLSPLFRTVLQESGLIQRERMGATAVSQTMNDEIHMKSDESYSTHLRRRSDSSFICEVRKV